MTKENNIMLLQEINKEIQNSKLQQSVMSEKKDKFLEMQKITDELSSVSMVEETKHVEVATEIEANSVDVAPVLSVAVEEWKEIAKQFKKGRDKFALKMAAWIAERKPKTFNELREAVAENWKIDLCEEPSYDMSRNFSKALLAKFFPGEISWDINSRVAPKELDWK